MSVKSPTTSRKLGDALTIYCPQETLTQNYRRYTARCKPLTSTTNRKTRLEFAKQHKESEEFWNGVYGPMSQRWTFDPKHTVSSVKHGGGVVMAWAYMTVSGTGPLIFTDDLMHDDSSRINFEGYKTILPNNIQENATRFIDKCFILYQDNDPKHPESSVKVFIKVKTWKVLDYHSHCCDYTQGICN